MSSPAPVSEDARVVLEAHQISHSYDRRTMVLDGLDLSITEGDRVAVVGPSGSGKTTLLSILGMLLKPTSGSVVAALQPSAPATVLRRDYFGWVFQSTNALPRRTVLDNVVLPLLARRRPLREAREVAVELLEEVGLGGFEDQLAYELSGGELQRLCIARALSTAPPVLLADEPTGQLDEDTSQTVIDALVRNLRPPTALLVATHDLNVATACDRIYRLRKGRLEDWRPE